MTAKKTFELEVVKIIKRSAEDVFKAIGEGRIFLNCGADTETLEIDFRVGGKYSIQFLGYGMKNRGEFLEIIPNKKIVFTWCQDFSSDPTPDTRVEIELKDLGGNTEVKLVHSGFSDSENRDAHEGGWTSGITDMGREMVDGQINMTRKFKKSASELFEICKNPTDVFSNAEMDIVESKINEKLVYSLAHSKVTLTFENDDESGGAWISLVHEGLDSDAKLQNQRSNWDMKLKKLQS